MKDGFWRTIPGSSKWDELLDDRSDDYLLIQVLRDSETDTYRNDVNNYTLYGNDEALLYRPTHLITRLGMELYRAVCLVIRKKE